MAMHGSAHLRPSPAKQVRRFRLAPAAGPHSCECGYGWVAAFARMRVVKRFLRACLEALCSALAAHLRWFVSGGKNDPPKGLRPPPVSHRSGQRGVLASARSISSPCAIAASASSPAGFGRAKSAVVLYLYGAPSQMDTLDPKPEAPAERRGEFGTIPSRLAGVRVCAHLPRIASTLDRMCLVRSMTHTSNNHAVSVALSGLSKSQPGHRGEPGRYPALALFRIGAGIPLEAAGAAGARRRPSRQRHPALAAQRPDRPEPVVAPRGLAGTRLQSCLSSLPGRRRRAEVGNPTANGPMALRSRYDPYDGVTPASTFVFEGAELPADVSAVRFAHRHQLLSGWMGSRRGRVGDAFRSLSAGGGSG